MKRQRNTAQMKEQTRNTEVQIKEEEISKLPEKTKLEKTLESSLDCKKIKPVNSKGNQP